MKPQNSLKEGIYPFYKNYLMDMYNFWICTISHLLILSQNLL